MDAWRGSYGDDLFKTELDSTAQIESILALLQKRLEGNYPFHHPQYAGQMLKPPHPVAWLAYALTATINPNNHALDGGPPTSEMEKETIHELAAMAGYSTGYLGHLTSAGTIANLEALFIAREIHPEKGIAASSNAHYTHKRMSKVLNIPFIEIPVDADGIPDLNFIRSHASKIGTLVVTMGTTGLGFVEPLNDLHKLSEELGFRIHVDAAYGGFFKTIHSSLPKSSHWKVLHKADSIVIDPHKHGLQPYGCGSVLYKDASVGTYFKHDSPYTYFTSDELHLGEISLECSRAGASAAAFWATLQLLPLNEKGIGQILKSARSAALQFASRIEANTEWCLYNRPDLDIVGYFKIPKTNSLSEISRLSIEIFEQGMNNGEQKYFISLLRVPANHFSSKFPDYHADADSVTILRSVFMKEEHENYIEEIANRLGI